MKNNYIIDFDSTFTQVEALDVLARISLADHPDRQAHYDEIDRLTNAAMDGKLSFRDSLSGRIKLLHANRSHLETLIKHLKKKVSASFSRNRDFFQTHADDVLIVSGGFKEFICPVVENYHIKNENVYANTFVFDEEGKIIGYDESNPLSEEGGKVKLLKALKLEGRVYGIGDGYSDFQLKESGLIEKFFAFTENIERAAVAAKADHITPNFDEFLYINKLPRAISYPRNRIICYMQTNDAHPLSEKYFKRAGFTFKVTPQLSDEQLKEAGMLLLEDGATLNADQIKTATSLKVIGYLGNSKNQVDRTVCSQKGIAIFDDKKGKSKNIDFIPRRMADFINQGDTDMSRNFPNLKLPKMNDAHRLIHIHENLPGVMAHINLIFARNNINIISQFLMTKGKLGYAVTDIRTNYPEELIKQLKEIENTIKFRLIY